MCVGNRGKKIILTKQGNIVYIYIYKIGQVSEREGTRRKNFGGEMGGNSIKMLF